MGLLDNLFKPKPETGGERIAESSTGGAVAGASEIPSEVRGTPGVVSKPPQFLAPKNYVPRSSVQVVPPTRGNLHPERKAACLESDAAPQMAKEIVLTLGDVLSRIPSHFLRQGMPDVRRELRFPAEGLAADIARGRASVSLTDIVAQCPEIFVTDGEGLCDVPIRLPLQKLVEQIGITAPSPRPAAPPAPTISSETFSPAVSDTLPDLLTPVAPAPGITLPKVSFSPRAPVPASMAEEGIHLSLAAILKRCPSEIIVRPLPPVDESVRVTFPFAPIERQLATGRVEVSSLRFIAALPLELMKCFEAQADVKVPLPIEEIFQNLPHQVSLPVVAGTADEPSPTPPAAHAAEPHEPEARLVTLARTDASDASVQPPPAIGVAELVGNSAPSVDTLLQSPISCDLPALSMKTAMPTDAPPAASSNQEPGLVRAFVPSLRPPVLIRAGTDSGVPETIFAELQAVDLSGTPAIDPEETMAAAQAPVDTALAPESDPPPAFQSLSETMTSPLVTSPIEPITPPSSIQLPATVAEHAEAPSSEHEATGAELPGAISSLAPLQVRPIIVQPPPIFVAAITSQAERQPDHTAQAGTDVLVRKAAGSIVSETVESKAGEHGAGFAEDEPKAADVTSPENTAEPAESETQERAVSRSAPNGEATEFVENEASSAELTPSDVPLQLDGSIAALLGTKVPIDLLKVSQLLAALPGIQACIVAVRMTTINAGDLPAGLDPESVRELGRRMFRALDKRPHALPAGEIQHLTLHADRFSLSLFTRGEACVCAVHRARIFLPGVREKFAGVAEELGRLS